MTASRSRHRPSGFSLIEILVVMAIVGIVMSVALLSLGVLGENRDLQKEARRVIALVELAQDEAMMQGREFGLELMTDGYRFVELDPFTNLWTDIIGDDALRMRQLPEDVEFELYLEDQRVLLDLDPAPFDKPDDDQDRDPTESYAPHVFIFSSGDMTPFELHILRRPGDELVALRSDVLGDMEIVDEDD